MSDEIYGVNAEFYDAAGAARLEAIAGVVRRWASQVPTGSPIADLGAGTGSLTAIVARAAAGSDVYAVEPSRAMRAVLAGRLADDEDLSRRVSVIAMGVPAAWRALPRSLGGVMMLAALPHLPAADRAALLDEIPARLIDGGSALVEVQQPWIAAEIPRQSFASVEVGRHRIEGEMQAVPFGDDGLNWTMTYRRVGADGTVLDETSGTVACWVVDPERFTREASAAGLTIEWRTDELAELRRRTEGS